MNVSIRLGIIAAAIQRGTLGPPVGDPLILQFASGTYTPPSEGVDVVLQFPSGTYVPPVSQ